MSTSEKQDRKLCEICEGSGQVCSFRGVSRFVLSWEDCPVCHGLGFTTPEEAGPQETASENGAGEDDASPRDT